MKHKVRVRVLRRHINNGTSSKNACPIALALKEQGFKFVEVDDISIYVSGKGKTFSGYTPKRAANFINKFDDEPRRPVKPFKFTLVGK